MTFEILFLSVQQLRFLIFSISKPKRMKTRNEPAQKKHICHGA
uniref:Uncharacterized protein n=1 Tax=Anguilla anguilla TaxID=7936 RepID=A0A0E9TBZ2_ANGAN